MRFDRSFSAALSEGTFAVSTTLLEIAGALFLTILISLSALHLYSGFYRGVLALFLRRQAAEPSAAAWVEEQPDAHA